MSAARVEYCERSASAPQIEAHLEACSPHHRPPLAARVDLREYALKIARHATTFEAWADGVLVGLVAAYLNDEARRTGFVSNVSVTGEFMGRGVAKTLMKMCLDAAVARGMGELVLEVGRENAAAIELYRKLGFADFEDNGNFIRMKLSLAGG